MSIQLGFYDLFSYLIPGFLYLYVLNSALAVCQARASQLGLTICQGSLPDMIPAGIPELGLVAFWLIIAFLTGHLFDLLAHWLVFRLIYRKRTSLSVLEDLNATYPDINLDFDMKDRKILLALLRQRNLALSQVLDKYEADSIMFRNLSLAALLFALVQVFRAVWVTPHAWYTVAVALLAFVAAVKTSRIFHVRFFTGVFLSGLQYGSTLPEVLAYDKKTHVNPRIGFRHSRKRTIVRSTPSSHAS